MLPLLLLASGMSSVMMTSTVSIKLTDIGWLGVLRATALIGLVAGGVGTLALMLYSGRNAPRVLVVLFAIWVLSPFLALAWASVIAKSWSVLTRTTLYSAMLVLAIGSLAIYGADAMRPRAAQAAFVSVVVAPASWLLIGLAAALARFVSGKRSGRDERI